MQKEVLSLLALTSISGLALAETQTLDLQKGWNLKGTYLDNVDTSQFASDKIKTIWAFEGNKWAVWSSDPQIQALIEKYAKTGAIKILGSIKAGEGFWILAQDQAKLQITGVLPNTTTLKLSKGWNLVSLKGLKSVSVSSLIGSNSNIKTVWKYDSVNQKWMVWSPIPNIMQIIQNYAKQGAIEILDKINPGEGFWVQVAEESELNNGVLEEPPKVGLAYVLQNPLNAVPLKYAKVYVNGKYIGTTNEYGEFSANQLKDGDIVEIVKKGTAPAIGIVKNGSVVVLAQKDTPQKSVLKESYYSGNAKPSAKPICSADGSVCLIVNSYKGNDLTVSVLPIIATSVVPPITSIVNAPDNTYTPDNLAVIGGFIVNTYNANGEPEVPPENINISYEVKSFNLLGDLNELLNGNIKNPSDKYQKFTSEVYNKLQDLVKKGQIDFAVLQFINGKWVYKGKASLVPIQAKVKTGNSYKNVTKYALVTENTLDTLAPTVFALKLNYITGETTVCVKESGYKMFDGSIVDKPDSNSPQFDWIGNPIPNVTILGDTNVQNSPLLTGKDGCALVKYKVPFVKPTFTLSFKKNGYYDTSITCEVDVNGAKCSDVKFYRIPDTASIEGYVLNKLTDAGIANATVTLVNPEVLSAKDIKYGVDDNGNAYVEVKYMPNVEYTWTAIKYDENGNKIAEIVIKQGKGDVSYAKLSENEIMDKLVKPFDEPNEKKPIDSKYLLGKWTLVVKAEHTFTNTSQKLVEEALGEFSIDILMPKLAELMGGQISEQQQEVTVSKNGTLEEIPNSIKNAAIYGGMSLGFLYEYGAQLDKHEWITQILGGGDPNTTGCIDDPIGSEYGICYINVTDDKLIYKKAFYPTVLNVKFLAEHFADLLKPDPSCSGDPDCEGQPFIKTGFTVRNMFHGVAEIPTQNGTQTIEKYVASYVDVPYDLNRKIEDLVDIPDIKLVGESVTAYMRQVITKKDGYYRINMIPPELNGKLEIFAKASGYKFDANADIKLVNDLEKGKVSHYNLYLEPINANGTPPKPIELTDWKNWNFDKYQDYCVNEVKWQVVTNPEQIKVSNTDWANTVWGTNTVSLLPDGYTNTQGYLWFGDNATGLYSDTGENTSSGVVCGEAVSPVMDLTKMSFPVLKFLSWFEVESVDVAKGMFDQLEIGFIIPKEENGGKDEVALYTSSGEKVTVKTDQYYPITLLNPDNEPVVQDADVPYSNKGVNAIPVWKEYTIPIEELAGYKVKFVFRFNSKDSLFNGFRGWGIDKIEVVDDMEDNLMYPPQLPSIGGIPNLDKKINRGF